MFLVFQYPGVIGRYIYHTEFFYFKLLQLDFVPVLSETLLFGKNEMILYFICFS